MDTNTVTENEELFAPDTAQDDIVSPALSLSEDDARLCTEFYKKEKCRKITDSELSLIDSFTRLYGNKPFSVSVSEFLTSSDEIARSFSDMAKKCAILSDEKNAEPTFLELADAADRYLARCGKERLLPCGYRLSCADEGSEPYLTEERLARLCGDVALVKETGYPVTLSDTDGIAYLSSGDNEHLKEFIAAHIREGMILLAHELCADGILPSLMTITAGFDVKLSDVKKIFTLSADDETAYDDPVRYLTSERTPSGYLIRTSKKHLSALVDAVRKDKRITYISIGGAAENGAYRLRSHEGVCEAEVSRALLCRLFSAKKRRYVTSPEQEILYPNATPSRKRYRLEIGGLEYDCAVLEAEVSGGFSSGLYSVLNTVGTLTELGHALKDIEVFTEFRFPCPEADEYAPLSGDSLCAMAGVYRAKAELSVGGGGACLFADGTASARCVGLARRGALSPSSEPFTELYLLDASSPDGSMIDLKNLRDMLSYIEGLRAKGTVGDVTYVGGRRLSDLLKELAPDRALSPTEDRILSFAFTVRAKESIHGIRL